MFLIVRSWLLPALFLTAVSIQCALAKPPQKYNFPEKQIEQVANSPTWKALLHVKNNAPKITDPNFLLSAANFSLIEELQLTLALFTKDPQKSICRFPARHLFLAQYFQLPITNTNMLTASKKCADLALFSNKVPHQRLSLIYASEVLSSASSMMGHVFLKAEGKNDNGNAVAHSISFFTQYDTFNPLTLIYDGLIGGMDGFFLVRPYENDLQRYAEKEQRNVFEYTIGFSDFEKKLIMMHIWELKDIDISYLFQSYNCATLTLYVLSLGDPKLRDAEKLFISPADVVKAIDKQNLIQNTNVVLANKWNIKLLEQELDSNIVDDVQEFLVNPNLVDRMSKYKPRNKVLATEYLGLMIDNTFMQSIIPQSNRDKLKNQLTKSLAEKNNNHILSVDFKQYKNPIDSQQDSILGLSLLQVDGNDYIDLSFLPASHYFRAKNDQFFSESELKIGEVILRLDAHKSNANIKELTLYSVSSLVPSTTLQPETSGNFYLGYKQEYNSKLDLQGYASISGGLGKTYKIHRDVMVFGLLNAGLSINLDDQFAFAEPKIGGIFNLAGNFKLKIEHSFKIARIVDKGIHLSNLALSWAGNSNQGLAIQFKHIKSPIRQVNSLAITFNYHF